MLKTILPIGLEVSIKNLTTLLLKNFMLESIRLIVKALQCLSTQEPFLHSLDYLINMRKVQIGRSWLKVWTIGTGSSIWGKRKKKKTKLSIPRSIKTKSLTKKNSKRKKKKNLQIIKKITTKMSLFRMKKLKRTAISLMVVKRKMRGLRRATVMNLTIARVKKMMKKKRRKLMRIHLVGFYLLTRRPCYCLLKKLRL